MSMFLEIDLICDLCSPDGKLRFCTVQIAEILNRKRGQKVDVVWHYDEIRQLVSVAIKLVKTVAHSFRDRPISQHTGSVTGIEFFVPAF